MANDSTFRPVDGRQLWREGRLPYTLGEDGQARPTSQTEPLPVRIIGSDPGSPSQPASQPTPVEIYAPEVLSVGASETELNVPEGANRAQATVTAGSARIGLGDAATAPIYGEGEGLAELAGAQLAGLRLIRAGGSDATVRVDYWRSA